MVEEVRKRQFDYFYALNFSEKNVVKILVSDVSVLFLEYSSYFKKFSLDDSYKKDFLQTKVCSGFFKQVLWEYITKT